MTLRFSDKPEYDRHLQQHQALFEARWLWGIRLRDATADCGDYSGFCSLCAAPVIFAYQTGAAEPVNLREDLHCRGCGLNARNRAALTLLEQAVPDRNARIYATEQASPAFRRLRQAYPAAIGSEYFDADSRPRLAAYLDSLFDGGISLHHEDATRLSFDAGQFDALVSSDVLEHIPDYQAALAEFARVLKPGGSLVLTVPFIDSSQASLLRAAIDEDGSTIHYVEPEYHGDPVLPQGILAYHSFGWDLLDSLRQAGFSSAHWCLPWDPAQGIFSGLWVLHARR